MGRTLALVIVLLALPLAAWAEPRTITLPPDDPRADLRPGPGQEVARRECRTCHSSDYIVMQPAGDARQWTGVVTKMIKVFGANISEADARTITEYLTSAYGR